MENNELTNIEIEKILNKKNIKLFNGIFMRDELKNFNKKGFYIINLDKSTSTGTHWCVIYKNDKTFYFDSYGFPPPEEIQNIIRPYIYSNKQIQDINSSSCGYYVILFIMFINKNKHKDDIEIFQDFLNLFNDDDYTINPDNINNEYILYKLLNKFNIII
jgi:hypothetical protein